MPMRSYSDLHDLIAITISTVVRRHLGFCVLKATQDTVSHSPPSISKSIRTQQSSYKSVNVHRNLHSKDWYGNHTYEIILELTSSRKYHIMNMNKNVNAKSRQDLMHGLSFARTLSFIKLVLSKSARTFQTF